MISKVCQEIDERCPVLPEQARTTCCKRGEQEDAGGASLVVDLCSVQSSAEIPRAAISQWYRKRPGKYSDGTALSHFLLQV